MSEKLNVNIEAPNDSPENSKQHHEKKHEVEPKHHESHHKLSAHEKQEQLDAIRQEVSHEAQPINKEKIDATSSEKTKAPQGPINKELKNMMRARTLTRIRKELKAPDKVLSKVIHSKPVETASAIGEKTIARPKGLLGGAIIALFGTLVTLYMAKHYGFRYNLLLFFMLFVVGYAISTLFEFFMIAAKKIKN